MIIHHHKIDLLTQLTKKFIKQELKDYLAKGNTLLLLSGGSVAKQLIPPLLNSLRHFDTNLTRQLIVVLVDERYGKIWHEQSNMLIFKKSGLVDWLENNEIKSYFPLTEEELTLDKTCDIYEKVLQKLFIDCHGRIIGLFGIGADCHTAGIKPQTTHKTYQALFGKKQLIAGYKSIDFSRITLTPFAINQVTSAVIFAQGKEKLNALRLMIQKDYNMIYKYPAVIFQKHPNCHLFTDQVYPS